MKVWRIDKKQQERLDVFFNAMYKSGRYCDDLERVVGILCAVIGIAVISSPYCIIEPMHIPVKYRFITIYLFIFPSIFFVFGMLLFLSRYSLYYEKTDKLDEDINIKMSVFLANFPIDKTQLKIYRIRKFLPICVMLTGASICMRFVNSLALNVDFSVMDVICSVILVLVIPLLVLPHEIIKKHQK